MIRKGNLEAMIKAIGYIQSSRAKVYEKKYVQFDCVIEVDFNGSGSINYPEDKGMKITRKTTCNFSQPENFVVLECITRLMDKGYRPEHIELEKEWTLGHSDKGGFADILVKDAEGKTLFIVECKTAGNEYKKELNNTLNDGGQLFSYWKQEGSCKWLSLYASDFDGTNVSYTTETINCSDDANILAAAKKDPSILLYRDADTTEDLFTAWDETYDKRLCGDVIFRDDSQAYQIGVKPLRKVDLKDFSENDKVVNKFEEILRHNNVSDKENAFNRLIALFICKLVDEIQKGDNDIVDFQYKIGTDTYETLQDRLQRLHKEGMEKFMREEIFYVADDYAENLVQQYTGQKRQKMIEDLRNTLRVLKFYTNNDFSFIDVHNEELFYQNGKILVEVVQLFESYRIIGSNDVQMLGDLFEQLLNKGFKQNEGQFFTPIPITRFIDSIFASGDHSDWEDEDIINEYLEKIHVQKDTYFSYIKRTFDYTYWLNDEYFKMYVESFIASPEYVNKSKQKSFIKLSSAEQTEWYNNKFYDYVDKIEREKLTYFALCYLQTTLIINSPYENKAQEKFLGYKWSNRKGQEGIQILSPGGLLYDEQDRNSQKHISTMIRNSFYGKACIIEGLEDYAYYLNLKDMLDFSSAVFTKTIKTIKARELKTTPGLVNYKLSDKSFELCIGNRVLSDEVETEGIYPIYSANVFEEFGRISKQNLTDFSLPSIIWGIDGDWMVNIIPAGQPFYPTDHCGVLRIKDNPDIIPDYFALALEVAGIHEKFSRHNRASTQRIKKLLIQIPAKDTQKDLLKHYQEIIQKIKNEDDSILHINQEIKQQYNDLFGTIESSKYGSAPLENVCQLITDGTHQTPTYTTEGNGIKFLSSKDVTKEYIDWSNIEYIPYELHEQLSKRISPIRNDILLAKNGTIGIAALNDTDETFDVYVSLAVLRPNELVTPEYLLCAINSEYTKKLFKDSIVGMGVPNLHLNVIQKTKIVLPDITEQLKFTSFVQRKLEAKKLAIQRKKKLEAERKEYLLSNF